MIAHSDITMDDITIAVNIIDAAIERGAFKGNEIYNIAVTREKLARAVLGSQTEYEGQYTPADADLTSIVDPT